MMDGLVRSLLWPVYQAGGCVQFWYVEYDRSAEVVRIGYELIGMPTRETRENLGEIWFSFAEARPMFSRADWKKIRARVAQLRSGN